MSDLSTAVSLTFKCQHNLKYNSKYYTIECKLCTFKMDMKGLVNGLGRQNKNTNNQDGQ